MAEKNPTLAPEKVRAVITTKWSSKGYQPIPVRSIESYMIESNLDQDSDNFSLVIGDHHNTLNALLDRDGEIRVQIFGVGLDVSYLLTGIVDDVDKSEDGRLTLSGRDNSAIATDTTAKAGMWREQKADKFIEKRARELGVTTRFNLAPGPTKKTIKTDGSESEWEFWYRLIRKEHQWLWFTSDGWLTSGLLNDQGKPEYYFGTNPVHVSSQEVNEWIPIEKITYKKTTQNRVGDVQVFYHSGGRSESLSASDPLLDLWKKRPLKYVEDKHIHTKSQAKKAAYEEIFEGKVGALEIQITIPDLGRIIRQNRVARLNVPELDLGGDWFVVGSRIVADEGGFIQEVRLREKNYAVSRRVPDDPETQSQPTDNPSDLAACQSLCDVIPRWCQFFINAAHKYRSALAFDHYLAVLCAICEQETGFRNIRNNGGPRHVGVEWFEWDGTPKNGIKSLEDWKWAFANEPGQYDGTLAVGPMQLYTLEYKQRADKFDGGKIDEFYGNRWLPEANIMTAAWVLTEGKANGSLREENLWAVVAAYGEGESYANEVRRRVAKTWLPKIQNAIKACGDAGLFTGDDEYPDFGAVQAAEALLTAKEKGWFDGQEQALGDVRKTAAGQSFEGPCGNKISLSAKILNACLFLIENGFSVYVWTFATGHDCLVDDTNRRSRHSDGFAVDIARLGRKKNDFSHIIGDGTSETRNNIMEAMKAFRQLTVDGGRPNQTICNGNGETDKVIQCLELDDYAPTCYVTGGHRDHLHVGY